MLAPRKPTNLVEFETDLWHIQGIIDDELQRRELLGTQGDVAQEWLDLFQLLAEYPNISKPLRSSIFKLMIRLSRKSGLHPQCLTISGVEKLGNHPIGGGAFGDVWKGRIGQQFVCLKVVRAFETSDVEQILKDYMQEAVIWRQLNHPNLLPFMGIYYSDMEQKQLCLVSPWMERGNLVKFLKDSSPDLIDHDLLAYDVACGLSHLHEMNIVHGDLKGVNILITPELRACIGDFGLSRISATQLLLSETSRSKGTMRWLSPELLTPEPNCIPSRESDVYAYAGVCYEIFTGRVPFYELADVAIVLAVVIDKKQPSRPEDCAKLRDSMWDMMVDCWNGVPSARPTTADVLSHMHSMNANRPSEPASGWNDPGFTQIWNNAKYPPIVQDPKSRGSKWQWDHDQVWRNDPDNLQVFLSSYEDPIPSTENDGLGFLVSPFPIRQEHPLFDLRRPDSPLSGGERLVEGQSVIPVPSAKIITDTAISRRTKIPKFFCEVPGCESTGFTEKHNFLYHTRSHGDIGAYGCPMCGKTFRSRSDLTRHTKAKRCEKRPY